MDVYRRVMARTIPDGDCLVFMGARTYGYGVIANPDGPRRTHRIVWEHHHGPTDLNVLHHCDNPSCVAIEHLFTGTQADNVMDMMAKRRANPARGLASGRGKLSNEQVVEIRRRRMEGELRRTIADDFGISPHYVTEISVGRRRG